MELCNSQPIRTKPNICIYLESIRVALSYQAQKDLINFKHYEQCHSTDNTYFCPRIEDRSLLQLLQPDEEICRSEILYARVYGLDLSKGIARVEIFFVSLKMTRSTRLYHPHRFILPNSSTYSYQQSFFSRSIKDWNNLPSSIIESNNIDSFSAELQTLYGTQ